MRRRSPTPWLLELDADVADVDRLAGATRYGTSAAVAQASITVGMQPGTAFADALVAGPVAASTGSLLLLVDSDAGTVEPTVALLAAQKGKIGEVVVVGGTAAVPAAVEAAVRSRIE